MVAIAQRHADGRRVARVEVKVGHLRQVVPAALTFAFDLLVEGTALDGAQLLIEDVPVAGVCRACGSGTAMPEFPLRCIRCGSLDVEVTAGEELLVESLELEEEPEEALTTNGGIGNG